jgi:hypothetical protein
VSLIPDAAGSVCSSSVLSHLRSFGAVLWEWMFEKFADAELWASNGIRQMVLSKGKHTLEQSLMLELNKWTSGQRKVQR